MKALVRTRRTRGVLDYCPRRASNFDVCSAMALRARSALNIRGLMSSTRLFLASSPLLPAIFVAADCGHRLLAAVAAVALLGCILYALWLLDSEWSAEPVRCSVLDGMTGARDYLAAREDERWRARAEYVAHAARLRAAGSASADQTAIRSTAPQQASDVSAEETRCARKAL